MNNRIDQKTVPFRTLYSGEKIPCMGLGTFGSDKYGAEAVSEAVYGAIKYGYRLIDCAAVYQNEDRIGMVLKRLFEEKEVERKDLFITSKVWNDMHGDGEVLKSCQKSLADLGLGYLDLYFVHWPFPNYHAPGCSGDSRNPDSRPFSVEEFMGVWRQCEELVDKGLVRYIGMSNMTIPKLEAVLPLCRIQPAALEMELHPSFQQPKLYDYALRHNILPIGYCPIGSPSRPERDRTPEDVADTQLPAVVAAANAHQVHPAVVCLKWAVQRGQVPIPFSVKEAQYISNLKCVTEDPLTEEEMEAIRMEDRNCRLVKGQVFLWEGAGGWEDLWDMDGVIAGGSSFSENYLKTIEEVIARGPYQPSWESLSSYETPKWYRDAKFGIFIHWGIYSVPAFGSEWYSRNMYIQGSPEYEHHRKTYGRHSEFGYKDFIPMFKAEKFDADGWAELFKSAGANYVVPVAEHHDGFQMYRSRISHWNAYEMGPQRDVLGELKESCRKKGMQVGASSHRVEHWFFMGHGKEFDSDIKEPMQRGDFYWPAMPEPDHHDLYSKPEPTEEYLQDWLVRTCEIIDNYRPKILYFDWWIQHSACKPYLKKLAAYYYNRAAEWGTEVVINYKHDAFQFGTAVPDVERGQFADVKPYFWQTDTAIALNSWCYTENNQFRPAQDIICDLVDIVSKNGCLLLNVGPKADGTISDEDRAVLLRIGEWLKVNGEAIYGTGIWRKYGEGPTRIVEGQFSDGIKKNFTSRDFRFTTKGGYLYAAALKCSDDGEYCITSLGEQDASKQANFHGIIRDVEVLGEKEKPEWNRDEEGLHIRTMFKNDAPVVFKIKID